MIVTPRYNRERGVLVTVDPTYPNAWRRKPYYVQLLGWAQRIVVEIRVGRRCIWLNADGSEREETKTLAWLERREEREATAIAATTSSQNGGMPEPGMA
jgi:hypothetical protein